MTSNITRAVAGLGAAAMLAAAAPAMAADPTDAMLRAAAEISAEYDLPAGLLLAVAEVESDFDPDCVTGRCVGLMQLHSAYAGSFARAAGMESYDLYDPEDSLRIAGALLAEYLDTYQGDLHMALMCYNLGEAGALRKLASGIDRTGYSRKVVSGIERWANVGLPYAPEPQEPTEDTAERVRAFAVGVWERVREVLRA